MVDAKKCPSCKQNKPLVDFPTAPSRRLGRGTYCRPCHLKKVQAWKAKNVAKVRENNRIQGIKIKDTQGRRARNILREAVLSGKIKRGQCEVCGTRKNVDGHHDDYLKPLSVHWLCHTHHMAHHVKLREAKRARA